jgi:hypothetical protein
MAKLIVEVGRARLPAGVVVREISGFLDLMWPHPTATELRTDPGVMLQGATRLVVLQRVPAAVRYYAAPLPDTPVDELIDGTTEIGTIGSIADACELARRFLAGEPLAAIDVDRAVKSSQ